MVQEKYSRAEATYAKIKEEVCQRALALDEAFSQSTQVRRGCQGGESSSHSPPGTATCSGMWLYSHCKTLYRE